MITISKEIFLSTFICDTLGWFLRNPALGLILNQNLTLGERFRMERGLNIHKEARDLYPDGILIDEKMIDIALNKTLSALQDDSLPILFEDTFCHHDYITKADILIKAVDGLQRIEVKSSINDQSEFIEDMAYTTSIIQKSGYRIKSASIMLVSRDYRLGMDDLELFVEIDHTDEVLARAEEFAAVLDHVSEVTRSPSKPEREIIFECKNCLAFTGCHGKDSQNHIFELTRISNKLFFLQKDMDIFTIDKIPDSFELTDRQTIIRDSVISGEPFIADNLQESLNKIVWQAYYLDFESVQTAIPLYSDIAPYQTILTQFSIHKCSEIAVVEYDFEYLCDPMRDCRLELTESLINFISGDGIIIVHSSYEKTVINGLIKLFQNMLNLYKR